MRTGALIGAAVFALSGLAAAQTWAEVEARYSPEYGRCVDAAGGVTFDMRECIIREYQQQDRRLNALYRGLMKRLDRADRADLRQRQRAWIKARDARCTSEMLDAGGGTASLLIASDCHLQRTTERVIYLEQEARDHTQ